MTFIRKIDINIEKISIHDSTINDSYWNTLD